MNDIKKAYFDDLKEKSILARSAKTGPRKQKYWKTNYSKKELEIMSGPTYRVNPNEFISYTDFKTLPDTLKKEYCQTVIDNWNIGPCALAKMWHITGGTVCPMLKRLGVKTNGKRSNSENVTRFFTEFVKSESPAVHTKKMALSSAFISFTGLYDEQSLLQQLKAVIPVGLPIKLAISIDAAE